MRKTARHQIGSTDDAPVPMTHICQHVCIQSIGIRSEAICVVVRVCGRVVDIALTAPTASANTSSEAHLLLLKLKLTSTSSFEGNIPYRIINTYISMMLKYTTREASDAETNWFNQLCQARQKHWLLLTNGRIILSKHFKDVRLF